MARGRPWQVNWSSVRSIELQSRGLSFKIPGQSSSRILDLGPGTIEVQASGLTLNTQIPRDCSQCPEHMRQCCKHVRGLVFNHLLYCFSTAHILRGYNRHVQTCTELSCSECVTATTATIQTTITTLARNDHSTTVPEP